MKTNKKKPKGVAKLKKELWTVFSQYIRQRDKGVCFSCGKPIPSYYDRYGNKLEGWKAAHAGHFITAKNCGLYLYFHEKNVNCQCYQCNINLSGNWVEYEKAIIKKYGQEVCDFLKQSKYRSDFKMTPQDYEEKIEEYKQKIKELSDKKESK